MYSPNMCFSTWTYLSLLNLAPMTPSDEPVELDEFCGFTSLIHRLPKGHDFCCSDS